MNSDSNSEEEQSNKDKYKDFKIIVVDDSDFSRKTMVEILETEGFNIVGEANSAEKALQVAMGTPCNLFIIDIVMPEISGIELAKILNEKFEDSKIIMVSSLKMENVIIESISNGAHDFISKPFEREELINSVQKLAEDASKE